MDRGHGATYTGGDNHLLEYWEEYQKMIEETKMLDDYLDEECPRSYDGIVIFTFVIIYYLSKIFGRKSFRTEKCAIIVLQCILPNDTV